VVDVLSVQFEDVDEEFQYDFNRDFI
jgi:hypothetical protein